MLYNTLSSASKYRVSVPQEAYHHLNTFFFLVKLNGSPAPKFYLQVRLILAKGSRETLDVLENT